MKSFTYVKFEGGNSKIVVFARQICEKIKIEVKFYFISTNL